MKKFFLIMIVVMNQLGSLGQTLDQYEKKEFIYKEDTLRYRILYPQNFDQSKKYPVVLFLHGSGERGSDNSAQLVHGAKLFLQPDIRQNYPAIVIFPQCSSDSFWAKIERKENSDDSNSFAFKPNEEPTKSMMLAIKLVKSIVKEKYVDRKRFYVGGLSMGGMGTFEILYRCPKLFAAAFPICGGGNPDYVKNYSKKVALWVFHGDSDPVVPKQLSTDMVDALKKAGGNVKLTIYPGVGHNSWDNAFAEPELMGWIFSNSK